MGEKGEIRSVADTALWVAGLRAQETNRSDAVLHDEWAELLAGERGREIARSMPLAALVAWGVVVRTSAIDRLVADVLTGGFDMVINLGAGMDTRPYRLGLQSTLRWIEIDFPDLVAAKDSLLSGASCACPVERVGLDLLDREARRATLERYGSQCRKALIITEGVIPYLSNEDVANLADEILSIPAFGHWLLDFDNAGKRPPPRRWVGRLKSAPLLFQTDDWFEFFKRCGWQPERTITSGEESLRLDRPYPLVFPRGVLMRLLPNEVRQRILGASGAVLLARRVHPELE